MQTTFSSSRLLKPARSWFIALSLLVALLLNFLPTAGWFGIPDWVALTLIFWNIRENQRVGMGWSFVLGLAMDVADASLLGQHALAYVLAAYAAAALARRVLWFPLAQQALHVLPLLLLVQALQMTARLLSGADYPGLAYFGGALVGALLWVPLTYLLLLPQHQPIERDANRPI